MNVRKNARLTPIGRERIVMSAAFAYALQFETAVRQFDIIGQWVPLADLRPSSVIEYGKRDKHGKKWIGPTWANIDESLYYTLTPSKTERTTGRRVRVDLKLCPLVMAAIASIPLDVRTGPLVVDDHTARVAWTR